MVTIQIIAAGKLKEPYLKEGIAEYKKRISGYADLIITEVPDEQIPSRLSERDAIHIRDLEGQRILKKMGDDDVVILLDLSGNFYSSEELAQIMRTELISGKNRITFVIGGTLGVSPEVSQRADFILSFSRLTLPHQLVRLVLTEQIYRAFRIMGKEPYHR